MKIAHLIAAATMIVGLGVSTAASAQDYRYDRHGRYDNRRYDDRHYRRSYRWNHGRSRCHREYRHHRRITVCYR